MRFGLDLQSAGKKRAGEREVERDVRKIYTEYVINAYLADRSPLSLPPPPLFSPSLDK